MSEQRTLVCMRLHALSTPGAVPGKCTRCGADIWISTSGMAAIMKDPNLLAVCMECVTAEVGPDVVGVPVDGAAEELGLTAAQVDEAVRRMKAYLQRKR